MLEKKQGMRARKSTRKSGRRGEKIKSGRESGRECLVGKDREIALKEGKKEVVN